MKSILKFYFKKENYYTFYINKFAMSVCLSRYAFGHASTYGAETWHGVGFGELGGTVNFSSRPDRSKVIQRSNRPGMPYGYQIWWVEPLTTA